MRIVKRIALLTFALLFAMSGLAWADDDDADIFTAILFGEPEDIQEALDNGADINAQNEDGLTPLIFAVVTGDSVEIVKALLDAGADVNAPDSKGFSPLIRAAFINNSSEIIDVLIKAGADVNARDNEGNTALKYARESNTAEVVKLLEQAGATE